MVLGKDDCVYVPSLGVYGRIENIIRYVPSLGVYGRIENIRYVPSLGVYGRIENIGEETFYNVEFPWDCIEDKVFEESELVKLENPYFPKGSIVTGLKGCKRYNLTSDKAIMEVINNGNDGRMLVKILQHKTINYTINIIHWVDSMWFKLARPRTNFYRGEKED